MQNIMEEIWKDIKDYPNYMVSNLGRVKSLGRWVNYKNKGKRLKEEKIMNPSVDKDGYQRVGLWKNRKVKYLRVHRLVYEAFVGDIPKGTQVNHINEIKSDNRLENLNLMTPKENSNWGSRNERIAEKKIKSVLQMDKTNKIIAEFPSINEVERQLGINQSNISMCCNGKRNTAGGFKWQYIKESVA